MARFVNSTANTNTLVCVSLLGVTFVAIHYVRSSKKKKKKNDNDSGNNSNGKTIPVDRFPWEPDLTNVISSRITQEQNPPCTVKQQQHDSNETTKEMLKFLATMTFANCGPLCPCCK